MADEEIPAVTDILTAKVVLLIIFVLTLLVSVVFLIILCNNHLWDKLEQLLRCKTKKVTGIPMTGIPMTGGKEIEEPLLQDRNNRELHTGAHTKHSDEQGPGTSELTARDVRKKTTVIQDTVGISSNTHAPLCEPEINNIGGSQPITKDPQAQSKSQSIHSNKPCGNQDGMNEYLEEAQLQDPTGPTQLSERGHNPSNTLLLKSQEPREKAISTTTDSSANTKDDSCNPTENPQSEPQFDIFADETSDGISEKRISITQVNSLHA